MIGKLGATSLYLALLVLVAGAWPASAQLPFMSPSLKKGEVYRALDGDTFRVVSKDEMEDEHGTVGKYTVEGDKVRVVVAGVKAIYYKITKEGLEEERLAKVKQEAQIAAHGDEAKKGAMVSVNGGCFEMGDTFGDGDANEKPVHKVCLDDYQMDKYEVTQSAYQASMGNNPSDHKNCANCPVEQVTWDEAKSFCEKVGKRLPTEAEWEYAAREGGKKVEFGTGKNEVDCNTANYREPRSYLAGDCGGASKPVGSYAPNTLGLYDMTGNVMEWVADWYGDDYYKNSPEMNPKGPSISSPGRVRWYDIGTKAGADRVLRGGSWYGGAGASRAAFRFYYDPTYRYFIGGFRCSQ
jgi:formylglycine-generating enzyme required for sulfatase activity